MPDSKRAPRSDYNRIDWNVSTDTYLALDEWQGAVAAPGEIAERLRHLRPTSLP